MKLAHRSGAVALGLLADLALGDPPTRWHPVGWFGTTMTTLEGRLYRDSRSTGVVHAAIGAGIGVAAARACPSVAAATTITVRDGSLTVQYGPFADTKERLNGTERMLAGEGRPHVEDRRDDQILGTNTELRAPIGLLGRQRQHRMRYDVNGYVDLGADRGRLGGGGFLSGWQTSGIEP